jgi:hypothetical protein
VNPFDALAKLALGWLEHTTIAAWAKFIFELLFSAIVSFLFTCGGMLMASEPTAIAVGFGMIWAAMAMVYLFRRERSKLTAGMVVALPGDEAAKEMAASFQTIVKPTKDEEKQS